MNTSLKGKASQVKIPVSPPHSVHEMLTDQEENAGGTWCLAWTREVGVSKSNLTSQL